MVDRNYVFIDTQEKFERVLPEIFALKRVGFDTETTGLDPHRDKLLLVQVGDLTKQYIIDARKVNINPLKNWLEDDKIIKHGSNLVFDYKFLKAIGIEPEGLVDSYLMEKILNNGLVPFTTKGYFSLEGMANKYLNVKLDKTTQQEFINHSGFFTKKQIEYAADDVIYPILIANEQKKWIVYHGLEKIVNLENKVIPAYGDMNFNGFYLNRDKWKHTLEETKLKLVHSREELDKLFTKVTNKNLFGESVENYGSQEQLKSLLKSVGYNLSDTMQQTLLSSLPEKYYKPIIDYRVNCKAVDSFGENYLDFINPRTGRIHCDLFQIGAVSGRNATGKPNLQNIKNESNYRECFTAQKEDSALITFDYAGQELRIAAQVTQEPIWIKLMNSNENVHLWMAENVIFNKKVDKKLPNGFPNPEYNTVKAINFSIAYGAGINKIMMFHTENNMACTPDRAYEILNAVEAKCPKMFKGVRNIGADTVINGYSTTILGRKRWFNLPPYTVKSYNGIKKIYAKSDNDEEKRLLNNAVREGMNHRIQGTGIEMLKLSLIYLRNECKLSGYPNRITHVVHDEEIQEAPIVDQDFYFNACKNSMLKAEQELLPDINPEVEGKIGKMWSH